MTKAARGWTALLLVLLCGYTSSLTAQSGDLFPPIIDLHHTTWTAADGLPPGELDRLARSSDGFLWVGSAFGARRFDGVHFLPIDSVLPPGSADVLRGIRRPMLRDRDGDVWFTIAGRDMARYRRGRFEVVAGARSGMRRMAQDSTGRIWGITGRDELLEWRNEAFTAPDLPADAPRTGILGVVADRRSGIWIGTRREGLVHVDGRTVRRYPTPSSITSPGVRPLLHASDGALWAFGDGLVRLEGTRWRTIATPDGQSIAPPDAVEDAAGTVWIATRGLGLLRWQGGRLAQFSESEGLSSAAVEGVLVDDEGVLWTATLAGLDRLRPALFGHLVQRLGAPFSRILQVEADADGALWVSAMPGGEIFRISGDPIDGSGRALEVQRAPLPRTGSYALLAAARGGGVWVLNSDNGRLSRVRRDRIIPGPYHGLEGRVLPFRAVEDRTGALVITFVGGELRRVTGGRTDELPQVGEGLAMSVAADAGGGVWATSAKRVLVAQWRDGRMQRWDSAAGLTERVVRLVGAGPDTAWGVTTGGRIVRFADGRVDIVSQPTLPGVAGTSGTDLAIADGALWFGNAALLVRAELDDVRRAIGTPRGQAPPVNWQRISAVDGIPVPQTMPRSSATMTVAADGRLWVVTPGGLAVTTRRRTPNRVPPRVLVEQVRVGGQVAGRMPWTSGPLRLTPDPDRVEIGFAVTSLRTPERLRVEYRLDGVDRSWQSAGPLRRAVYPRLGPGRYRFRVRAWNEDGVASSGEAQLAIGVPPAWHQSWLLRSAVLLALAGLTALELRRRHHVRLAAAEDRIRMRYAAMLAERTRVAGELHDTVLQTFTGIAMQLKAVQTALPMSPERAERTLDQTITLATTALRETREAIWDLRAPVLAERGVVSALTDAVREVVGDLPVRADVSSVGTPRPLPPCVEGAAYRIGREAIVNAVRHAAPARIDVQVRFEPAALVVEVRDDGIGLAAGAADRAVTEGHWGIQGMHERAAREGGTLDIVAASNGGTTVRLRLPLEPLLPS